MKLKHPISVSSLSFKKNRWTRTAAAAWLAEHGYGSFKVRSFGSTKNYWRARVREVKPNTCRYRVEHWGSSGILATYCIPKKRKPKVVDLSRMARSLNKEVA